MTDDNISSIKDNFEIIFGEIKKIKEKITKTETNVSKINENKLLTQDLTNSNLLLQISVLKNEHIYIHSLINIVLETFSKDIQELVANTTKILTILNCLEYEPHSKKKELLEKIKKIKLTDTVSLSLLNENINILFNNLPLIKEFINLFDSFINETKENSLKDNVHNSVYELDIYYKKEKLLLEYNKCNDLFLKIIEYFNSVTENILKNITQSCILKLYL